MRIIVVLTAMALLVVCNAAVDAGDRCAILVGVGKYQEESFPDLPGAEPDVKGLADVLIQGGFQKDAVTVMSATEGAVDPRKLPTASRIRKQLRRLAKIDAPDSTVVIALAGHGVQPIHNNSQDYYFCPLDADLGNERTLISVDEIYSALDQCQAEFKLLLVDACREDTSQLNIGRSASGESGGIQSVTRRTSFSKVILPEPPRNTAAFFSCSPGELAYERQGTHNSGGVFFHAVIRGLAGAAADQGNTVTLPGLERFVKKDVEAYVRGTYSAAQHPVMRNATSGLRQIVRICPTRKHVQRARDLWIRGHRDAADEIIDDVLTEAPEDAIALAAKARMMLELAENSVDESIRHQAWANANAATSAQPAIADGHVAQADLLRSDGKMQDALAACDRALQCDANSVDALVMRAAVYQQLDDKRLMLRDIERAIELDPVDPMAVSIYAAILFYVDRSDQGFEILDEAIGLMPDVPMLHFMRGFGLDSQGRYDKAILAYTAAIRVDPNDADLLCRRAVSLANAGDFPGAIDDINTANRISPNNPNITGAHVVLLNHQQKYHQAISVLDKAVARFPDELQFYQARAALLTRVGRNGDAARDRETINRLSQSQ